MAANQNSEIQRAVAHLQAGRKLEAREILTRFIRREPSSEAGWLLLSEAVDDPFQRTDCLQQVLRINPLNFEARQQLGQIPNSPIETLPAQPPVRKTTSLEKRLQPYADKSTPVHDLKIQANPTESVHTVVSAEPQQPAVSVNAASRPTARRRAMPGNIGRKKGVLLLVIGCLVALLVCVAASLLATQILPGLLAGVPTVAAVPIQNSQPLVAATPNPAIVLPTVEMPATWTPTLLPGPTATRTVAPTAQPSPTSTYLQPMGTPAAVMARIEKEVSDLRGLPILKDTTHYLVSSVLLEQRLQGEIEKEQTIAQLEDLKQVLAALELIKPTYDLVRYAMNGLADNIGGLYLAETDEIFVVGLQFGGVEHYIYSHEYDHALVDQHYDLVLMEDYAQCQNESDRCTAMRALIEGDATLMMNQWFSQYAGPQDFMDIFRYRPPAQLLPEQAPPDFVVHSLNFPYVNGLKFVEYLYDRGNWRGVNEAYTNPPVSTEQILHPEKYLAGEMPVPIQDPVLGEALGSEWRGISNEVLGEWMTFLMLAYSADLPARRPESTALKASSGWGGDQIQVSYNDSTQQAAMAAHWNWDSTADANEFNLAISEFVNELMRGAQVSSPSGTCWEGNGKAACLYAADRESLWLVAPDQATLEKLIGQFADLTGRSSK